MIRREMGDTPRFPMNPWRPAHEQLTYKKDRCEWCGHVWQGALAKGTGDFANQMHFDYVVERTIWLGLRKVQDKRVKRTVACDTCASDLRNEGWENVQRCRVI